MLQTKKFIMETTHLHTLVLVAAVCGHGWTTPVATNSACNTPDTVNQGDAATIVCHFNRSYKTFMVYRVSSQNTSEIVALCPWNTEVPECDLIDDGHRVNQISTKQRVVIEIQSVQQKHSGRYFCKTLPANQDNADYCTLSVQSNIIRKGNLVTCNANPPALLGQKASVTCEFSENIGGTGITLQKQSTLQTAGQYDIVTCNKKQPCELKKEGYLIEEESDKHVRVSIPYTNAEHLGYYTCQSAGIKAASDNCELKQVPVLPGTDNEQPTLNYFVLAVGVITLIAVIAVFAMAIFIIWKRHQRLYTQVQL